MVKYFLCFVSLCFIGCSSPVEEPLFTENEYLAAMAVYVGEAVFSQTPQTPKAPSTPIPEIKIEIAFPTLNPVLAPIQPTQSTQSTQPQVELPQIPQKRGLFRRRAGLETGSNSGFC